MGDITMRADAVLDSVAVGDAMHAGVLTCAGDAPLLQVAATMAENGIHSVIVSDLNAAGPKWGVVSDLDLVSAAVGGAGARTAREVAATPVVRVTSGDSLQHAAQLMAEYQTSHLVVVDTAGDEPVGIVSTLDVAQALARE